MIHLPSKFVCILFSLCAEERKMCVLAITSYLSSILCFFSPSLLRKGRSVSFNFLFYFSSIL